MKRIMITLIVSAFFLSGCSILPAQPATAPTEEQIPTTIPTQPTTQPVTEPTEPTTLPVTEPTTAPTEPETVPTTVPETEPILPTPETLTAQPGVHTLSNFLATAMLPVGQTMYVWGGGWNDTDDGSGEEAVTIGVPRRWKEFFLEQDSSYDMENTRFQIHDGLDCSGYLGWLVYNTMNTESGGEGFVMPSTQMAQTFAEKGFGELVEGSFHPGDVVSMSGHVWVCLGVCEDGSVVLVHSSPAGVSICGTVREETSQAEELARKYMSACFPEWYEKFPNCARSEEQYLNETVGIMRWNRQTLADPEGMEEMDAAAVLEMLLGNK